MAVAMAGLLMGASRCDPRVVHGGHQHGGGGHAGSGAPGEACGDVTCPSGQVCCNESCGICTAPGGFCTEQFCEPGGGEACGDVTCPSGQVCCNASCGICTEPGGACTQQFCEPEPKVFCGGIAGIDCPGEGECVDDPSDSCDPNNGGADCGGMCDCSRVSLLCVGGTHFDDSPSVCACVP
jgi:hypothetical protein